MNGKVERSHRSDQQDCYQFLPHKGDVDLEAELSELESYCNFNLPHVVNRKAPMKPSAKGYNLVHSMCRQIFDVILLTTCYTITAPLHKTYRTLDPATIS